MASEGVRVETWQTPEVVAFLRNNDLGAIAPIFEENEVTGLDLTLLTEDELRSMLHISKLQAAKIKTLISAGSARPADEDPARDHDFNSPSIPRISANDADFGDEAEQAELRRAVTGNRSSQAPIVVGTVLPVNVPVLPTGTGALRLDAPTVERYKQYMTTITALEAERVAQELPGARSRLDSTRKRLKLQEKKFEELRKDRLEQNEKVDKLVAGKWYPGKYIMGARKREEKIERNTAKLQKVSNQFRAAGAQLEELNIAATAHSKFVSDLTAKCATLDEAHGFCSSLLQSAFAGGAIGDSRENVLETEVAALGPKLEEVHRYKSVYGKAYELMRGSLEALDEARQLLQAASGLANVDMIGNVFRPAPFDNSVGGLMVDMVKRAKMRQGMELCRVAADLAIRARTMLPDMPRVKIEKLKELRMGFGLMDVVFDNMISDMIVAGKIRGMLSSVEKVQSDVQYAERWLEGWIRGRIDTDLKAIEAQLASKRIELHSHRMQLMHQWIEARDRGAVQEAQQPHAVGVPVAAPRHYVL